MLKIKIFKAAKEISWITLGQFLTIICGLFGIRILTNYLTPSQYGDLSLGLSLGVFINTVFMGPISNGASRFFSAAKLEDDSRNYFKAVFNIIFKVFVFVLIFSILLIAIFYFLGYQKWINLIIASLCFGCFYSLNNILNNIQNASRKRYVVAIHKSLMTFFRFLFAFLLIKLLGDATDNAMYGQALGMIIVLLSQLFFLRKLLDESRIGNIQKKLTYYWQSKIIKYSWPFATWGILSWAVNSIDRWALHFYSSPETVGLYAVIYQVGYYPISILISLLTNYLEPIYFQKAGDGDDSNKLLSTYRLAMRINFIFIIFLAFLVLIGFCFHKTIFSILLDQRYHSVSYFLGPMMLISLLDGNSRIISILLQTTKDTRALILPNCVTGISGIILSLIGAYFFDLKGILFAFMINMILKFIWFYSLVRVKFRNL